MSIPSIPPQLSAQDSLNLKQDYLTLDGYKRRGGFSALTGVLLIGSALIAITLSIIYWHYESVNTFTEVMPAAGVAIVLSIPILYYAYTQSKPAGPLREKILDTTFKCLKPFDEIDVPKDEEKKDRIEPLADFIYYNLIPKGASYATKTRLTADLKEKLTSKKGLAHQAIEEAEKRINFVPKEKG